MTRTLTRHQVNPCNKALTIRVCDEPGPGGACSEYEISHLEADGVWRVVYFKFQNGNPSDGINGITNEALLAIVEDRLKGFCGGPFACDDNKMALFHAQDALDWLKKRSEERITRGVEGQAVP